VINPGKTFFKVTHIDLAEGLQEKHAEQKCSNALVEINNRCLLSTSGERGYHSAKQLSMI